LSKFHPYLFLCIISKFGFDWISQ